MAHHDAHVRSGPDEGLDGFPVLRRDVAGIDVGSEQHWVCGPAREGFGREIAVFAATTPGLEQLTAWLRDRRVTSVALESTGVYWIVPHEMLEAAGFAVVLADTRTLGRVPGRPKSDRRDCEWLQRMQKSLDQMNVRVHRAVSDLDGVTGMAILRAIAQGERDPHRLAALRHRRCQKSEAEIAAQLTGHWRADHLFSLQQALHMYDAITARLTAYDGEIQRQLAQMPPPDRRDVDAPPPAKATKAKAMKTRGDDPLRHALYRVSGVDLTSIDALGVETVSIVLSEYGSDLSRFPTERHFVAHMRLAPYKPISGGKVVTTRKKPASTSARVAAALRMAALAARRSQTALGAYYRRLAQRCGADVAVFATARKLAQYIYRLLRWGQPYVDEGAAAYETRYHQARVKRIAANAKQLGYALVPVNT